MGGGRVVRLHVLLVLFLVFVNFCLTKKEKRKKRKLLPFAKVFSLFDFCKSFLREIRPKNYYSRKFLLKISRFFDLAKVSARESICSMAGRFLKQRKIKIYVKVLFVPKNITACELTMKEN